MNLTPKPSASWKAKALLASRSDPLMAGILRVMVGRPAFAFDDQSRIIPGVLPGFGPRFRITADGVVTGTQVNQTGDIHYRVALCDTEDLRDNLNRLADAIAASDDERREMFAAFVSCVHDDMRAIINPADPLSTIQKRAI